jgi:hypothetical protein
MSIPTKLSLQTHFQNEVIVLHEQRSGMQSSYTQRNRVRARALTHNPAICLLPVGLVFVFFNSWISLRYGLSSTDKEIIESDGRFWQSLCRPTILLACVVDRFSGIAFALLY